jgi:superfamily II DNA or RNA helicase
MINLYDYQNDIVRKTRAAIAEGKTRILIQSPTGSGKTVIFSYLVAKMRDKKKRALIISDRVELLFETGGTLEEFNLKPHYITQGYMVEPLLTHQVYVAMSQTLRRRIGKWDRFFKSFDVVIIDECHKQEFNPFFEEGVFPEKTIILGFSATPVRSGKMRQLGEDYQIMIEGLQIPELIKRGRLVPDRYFAVDEPDMSGVGVNSHGDYKEGAMFERFNKTQLYSGVVENWSKICPNTSTLVFCVNIQHTIETCRAFNRAGIKAKFIVSPVARPIPPAPDAPEAARVAFELKMREFENWQNAYVEFSGDRETVVGQWKRNEFYVLVNAGILTTGFNRRDLQSVVVNRATLSVALWLQMIGRGSRTFEGKTHFNLLDFGGNGRRLGYYNQERQWSLFHDYKESTGVAPIKECKGHADENGNTGCGCYVFSSATVCNYCGYIFEKKSEKPFAELIEVDYLADSLASNSNGIFGEKTLSDELKDIERIAESRGYKAGWIVVQILAKYGEKGLKQYAEMKKHNASWYYLTLSRYQNKVKIAEAVG